MGRPPVAGRDEQRRFWLAIATGMSSEDAALEVGVSQPAGTRWFRKARGMPPAMFRSSAKPLSGRYLSLVERGYRAISCRRSGAALVDPPRRSPLSCGAMQPPAVSRDDRPVARRAIGSTPQTDQACAQCDLAHLCGGEIGRHCRRSERHSRSRSRRVLEGPPAWPATGSAMGPEQIARRLLIDFPDDETMRIRHEAIYQALFVQGRGALRRELTACCEQGGCGCRGRECAGAARVLSRRRS